MTLHVRDLSFSYGRSKILKDVTFDIIDGEFLALMGPNGSGKTTLLRCLTRYLPTDARAILVDMRPLHTMTDREIARMFAVVPQTSSTDFPFTAFEIVLMGRIPHVGSRLRSETKEDEAVVLDAMRRTGCESYASRPFSQLSGGERQRVILARALAQEPKVLLLDEPTVYLDISGQIEMMDLMRDLNRKEGLTIVSVLHDINLAARYCGRIALLDNGRLQAIGPPEEVFTPDTVQAVYGVDVAVRRDPFTHGVYVMPSSARTISSKNGKRVHVLCGGGTGGPLMRALVDNGYSASVGVLNVLDSDYEIASDLRIPVVAEVPFAQISEEMHAENLRRVDESSIVVVSRFPVGPGNFKNLEAAMHALDSGKTVFIFRSANPQDVDFVGGRADAYIDALVDKGATEVRDVDALVAAIEGGPQK